MRKSLFTTNNMRLWYKAILHALLLFVLSAGYLWLRRFGAPFADVVFKLSFASTAVAGTALLAMAYAIGPLAHFWPRRFVKHLGMRMHYGIVGYWISVIHAVWAMFTYVPKGFVLLFGITSLVLFSLVMVTSISFVATNIQPTLWKTLQRVGYLALAFALMHFALLKYKGWLAIATWPTLPPEIFGPFALVALPPLSLILFVAILAVFVLRGLTLSSPDTLHKI